MLVRLAIFLSLLWPTIAQADPMRVGDIVAAFRPEKPDAQLSYGSGKSQTIDVFMPVSKGRHPVIVLIHGGCWNTEVSAARISPVARDLTKEGFVVWNVEYRRIGEPGGGYPGMYDDIARAVDALRDNAARFNLDLQRVYGVGHSAGGHLALWAASRHKLAADSPWRTADPVRFKSVVSIAGVGDLKLNAVILPIVCPAETTIDKIVGPKTPARPDPFADTSPRSLLPTGVSTLQVTGIYDDVIPPYVGLWWRQVAKKAGDIAEDVVVPDAAHVDVISLASPAWPTVRATILKQFQQ